MKELWAQPHKRLKCMSFIIIFLTIVLLVLKFHGAENILFVFLFWIVLPLSNGYQNLLEWHVFANWIKGEITEDFFFPNYLGDILNLENRCFNIFLHLCVHDYSKLSEYSKWFQFTFHIVGSRNPLRWTPLHLHVIIGGERR